MSQFEKGGGKKFSPHPDWRKPDSEYERTFKERQKIIYNALIIWVGKKLEGDPGFSMATKDVKKFMEEHPLIFPGRTENISTVIRYFGGEINFLNEKLGLPTKSKRQEEY